MRKLYTFAVLFCFFAVPSISRAQVEIRCGTVEYQVKELQEHPSLRDSLARWDALVNEWVKNYKKGNLRGTPLPDTIPVVIHLVYNPNSNLYVTDWAVQSQIDVLNEDMSRQNADAVRTPAAYQPIATNCGFQFRLAQRDPNGNPTTGILRETYPNHSNQWDPSDPTIKQDFWPESEYMNVFVCDMDGGLLGLTVFPYAESSSDCGIIVKDSAFGRYGNSLLSLYALGRTLSHEFGHWVDCYHVWGTNDYTCGSSDSCADTPPQSNPTYDCPSFPDLDMCTDTGRGVAYFDYLDYSPDSCMNMYTQDQKARMMAAMNIYPLRQQIKTSLGAKRPASYAYDLAVSNIKYPAQTIDKRVISPVITLSNLGTNAITSCTINYEFFRQGPYVSWVQQLVSQGLHQYDWDGNLAAGQSEDITLPSLTDSTGFSFLVAYAYLNDGTDEDTVNNFSSRSYYVPSTATFPPKGIKVTPEYTQGSREVIFQFDTILSNDFSLQVFNIMGQLVPFRASNISVNKEQVDLMEAPYGVYIARFRNGRNYDTAKFEYFPANN